MDLCRIGHDEKTSAHLSGGGLSRSLYLGNYNAAGLAALLKASRRDGS